MSSGNGLVRTFLKFTWLAWPCCWNA
ncbi:uncharacterized protein METZ01_LOCUS423680, partial [marine metagenome]